MGTATAGTGRKTEARPQGPHGSLELPSVTITGYNVEIRDEDGGLCLPQRRLDAGIRLLGDGAFEHGQQRGVARLEHGFRRGDALAGVGIEQTEPTERALDGAADEAGPFQRFDVLGGRRQRHVEGRRQFPHCALAVRERAQHPAAGGVAQGVENGVEADVGEGELLFNHIVEYGDCGVIVNQVVVDCRARSNGYAAAMGRIVIVSGPPGAGKSTVARRLAERSAWPLAMHMHTDDLYAYIRKGFVPPWRPEAMTQNVVLMQAMAASSAVCARGGYEVLVDGIVGPSHNYAGLSHGNDNDNGRNDDDGNGDRV